MNDKITIRLSMAGATYPITIDRKDEEIVRAAAKQVDEKFRAYRAHYRQDMATENILGMVAYAFALENMQLENQNDTAPYTDKIKELTEELDRYFKGE